MIDKNKKYEDKLKELEEKYEKETVEYRKKQLYTKIYEYKKKHFPTVFHTGGTYIHY